MSSEECVDDVEHEYIADYTDVECSTVCEGTKTTDKVTCEVKGKPGVSVHVSVCPGETPETMSQTCNEGITCEWVDAYGECDKTCGGGTQVFTPDCKVGSAVVPDENCAGIGAAPTKDPKACNEDECVTPTWDDAWGDCSATCGGGTQTYTPECKEGSTVVDSSKCSNPAPTKQTQNCNTESCGGEGVQDSAMKLTIMLTMFLVCLLF